mgnify:CR=1 FL=1
MPKLPVISGEKLIKIFSKLGYVIVRQKGSHVQLQKYCNSGLHTITVPNHNVVAFGTLNEIIKSVSLKRLLKPQ